jgi:hypothetical protein
MEKMRVDVNEHPALYLLLLVQIVLAAGFSLLGCASEAYLVFILRLQREVVLFIDLVLEHTVLVIYIVDIIYGRLTG